MRSGLPGTANVASIVMGTGGEPNGELQEMAAKFMAVSDRAYVLDNGASALSGPVAAMYDDPDLKRSYLGL
jgi:hypothetical protein